MDEIGYGTVNLHIRDRFKPLVMENISIDSIAPGRNLQFAILEMEDIDGTIFHVPNVDFYTVDYS